MTSYLYRAPAGVAGDVTRPDEAIIESGLLDAEAAPAAFGVPVKVVNGKIAKIASGDTAAKFYGVLTRVVPAISGSLAQGFDDGTPNPAAVQGVIVGGYVNVKCTVGTPARGGTVYMRVTAATGKAIGDLEATADSTNNVALTGVIWSVDGKDADNVTEIRIK